MKNNKAFIPTVEQCDALFNEKPQPTEHVIAAVNYVKISDIEKDFMSMNIKQKEHRDRSMQKKRRF